MSYFIEAIHKLWNSKYHMNSCFQCLISLKLCKQCKGVSLMHYGNNREQVCTRITKKVLDKNVSSKSDRWVYI